MSTNAATLIDSAGTHPAASAFPTNDKKSRSTPVNAATLIERAHVAAAEVIARAAEIDSGSKLPDDLIAKFVDFGLTAALVPKRYGGHECGLDTAIEIVRIMAAAAPAAGWVLGFYIGHNWIHCQFPEQAQDELFANGPSPLSGGVLAPTLKLRAVDGGYRVSGRNAWNSGSPHADWILGSGMVVEGPPVAGPLVFVVPQSEVTLHDTWEVAGMKATGSWDAVFDDVFVPAHRTLLSTALLAGDTPGSKVHANPAYSRPLILVTFAYSVAVFVGALRGASQEFLRVTRTRVATNDGKPVVEKPGAHIVAGRGEARAHAAEVMLSELVTSVMAHDAAERFDVSARLGFKAKCSVLSEFCKDSINDLVLGSGASAFMLKSRMQMIFRDINMISVHAFFDKDASAEGYGRVLLGLENKNPI